MIAILEKHGLTGETVPLSEMLHLKTGVSYLEENKLVATGEFLSHGTFEGFDLIPVSEEESYAANCIWINGTVILAEGYPNVRKAIAARGYDTIAVDVSEFRKLDGGLSCLSLRF